MSIGRPLLVAHGEQNQLLRPVEAQALYDRGGSPKRLVFLENAGHTEWMFDGDPIFKQLAAILDEFFNGAFADA